MTIMRNVFRENLDQMSDMLVEMTRLAGSAMSRATTSLLDADLTLAETVIAADDQIDRLRTELEDLAIDLLARQQPVATDLRMVVTAMHMATDLERMGDLAQHIAKVARLRYPKSAIPPELRGLVVDMGQVATRIVAKAGSIIAARDVDDTVGLASDEDKMDALHRHTFQVLLAENWEHPMETAVDMTLLARYYERFADHAVTVSRQVAFLVTGTWDRDPAAATATH